MTAHAAGGGRSVSGMVGSPAFHSEVPTTHHPHAMMWPYNIKRAPISTNRVIRSSVLIWSPWTWQTIG